ncbi:MAG TPA: MFS transporter [Candidatus Aquilonibacter sp.]
MKRFSPARNELRWQVATIVLLFAGYAGVYFCRANLAVAAPLLIADLHLRGMSINDATLEIGALASVGTLAYAFGKFFLVGFADFFGGKRVFIIAMLGAVVFTVIFASATSTAIFMLAWVANRLLQSVGWAGMVKVTSKWFPYAAYGSVMAILSLSFLVGDTVTRGGMGALIAIGFGWRGLFLIGAGALAILLVANAFVLKESSVDAGFSPPPVNPLNVYGERGAENRPADVRALLRPLLSSAAFWLVCALSFGTTLLRETFGTWTPTFLTTSVGFSAAQGAAYSAIFPASGVASVLIAGWLSDRLGATSRARIAFIGLLLTALALTGLGFATKGAGLIALALLAAVGFFNSGPYSYLAGAMALDFGGRKGSALSSGIIDGVGYLGGALAGVAIARIELTFGWSQAFFSLAILTTITALCAAMLARVQMRRRTYLAARPIA